MPRKSRIAFITFAACDLLAVLYLLFSIHFWDVALLDGKPGREGICFQSTGWTCGPAAAVTLLGQLGLPATEGEMTRLCQTEPWFGTNQVMLALALREKALPAGYDFVVLRSDWQDLRSRRLPAIADVWLNAHTLHCTVVLDVDDGHVTLLDPLRGKQRLTREEFLSEWLNSLVAIAPGGK